MDFSSLSETERAAIDLHGHTVFDAEEALVHFLDGLPKGVRMVEVTHGFHRGTALKRMVKDEFYHWRVVQKRAALNAGVTYFVLK